MQRYLPLIQAIITSIVTFRSENCASESANQYSQVYSSINRDVVAFGALLPLHFKDHRGICKTAGHSEGYLWLSALNYAVEDVNRKWKRTFNASLTLKVRDTCNDGQIALEQALDFTNGYRSEADGKSKRRQENITNDLTPVLGVISASHNQNASTLLSLFKVPQIIFGKGKFVVENSKDMLQSVSVGFYKARALADLVKYFTWNAVSAVYSPPYEDDFETFLRISTIENLCVAVKVYLSAGGGNSSDEFESAVDKIFSEPQSNVVILFTGEVETTALIKSKLIALPSSRIIFAFRLGNLKVWSQHKDRENYVPFRLKLQT